MNKSTPAKHRTPNYRFTRVLLFPQKQYVWGWMPIPLRADRKDINAVESLP